MENETEHNKVVDLKGVNVYQGDIQILSEVDLEINKGQFLYLVGETGSGKSSLMKTLYADLVLKVGEGFVCGYGLKDLKRKEVPFLRRKLGIVFQNFELLMDRDVHQNLIFVLKATGWTDKAAIKKRIQEVLDQVNLKDVGAKKPHQLSGGEQQRVAIARALLNQPELILADEPTGNLDPDTSEQIIHLLSDISMSGTAVLMATHDVDLMKRFPSPTLECKDGKLNFLV